MATILSLNGQALETRTMPASQVTASVAAGVLTLSNTDDDNSQLELKQTGTTIEVFGLNGTTIVGGPIFTGVTALRVNLGAGDDRINIDPNAPFALAGAVTFNLGDGTNGVSFATNGKLELGSLIVLAEDGPDTVNIFGGLGSGSKIAGNVVINTGVGYNSQEPPYLDNNITFTNLEIAGAGGLKYTAQDGNDVLTLQTVKLLRALNATGGEGMMHVVANNSQIGSVTVNSSGPATGYNTNGAVFESSSTTVAGTINLLSGSGAKVVLGDVTSGPLLLTTGPAGFTTTNISGATTVNGNVVIRGGRHSLFAETAANVNVTGAITITGSMQASLSVIDASLVARSITLSGSGADVRVTEFDAPTVTKLQTTSALTLRGRTVDIDHQSGQIIVGGALSLLGGTEAHVAIGASLGDVGLPTANFNVTGPALVQARSVSFGQSESQATFGMGLNLLGAEKTTFASSPWALPGHPDWYAYPPYGEGATTTVNGKPFVLRGREVEYTQYEGETNYNAGWQVLGGETASVEVYPEEIGTNPDESYSYGLGADIRASQLTMTGEQVDYYQAEGTASFPNGVRLTGTASATFNTESGNAEVPTGTTVTITNGSLLVQAPSATYYQVDGTTNISGDLTVKGTTDAVLSTNQYDADVGAKLTVDGHVLVDAGRGEARFGDDGELLAIGKNLTVKGAGLNRTSFDSNAGSTIGGHVLVTGATLEHDSFAADTNLTITGNLTINLGSGANNVDIGTNGLPTIVNGNFTITTGNGSDTIALANMTINGNTNILTGAGTDRLYALSGTVFSGTVVVDLGSGSDTFHAGLALVDGFGSEVIAAGPVTFKKPATVKLGSGNDGLKLGISGDANGQVLFLDTGALSVDGGSNLNLFDNELGQFDSTKVFTTLFADPTP